MRNQDAATGCGALLVWLFIGLVVGLAFVVGLLAFSIFAGRFG